MIKAAEKIESTTNTASLSFEAAVRAVAQWATEEDSSEIRVTAEPLRVVAKAVATAFATSGSDAAALATAFARVAELENTVAAAERDHARAEQASAKAEMRVLKAKQGEDKTFLHQRQVRGSYAKYASVLASEPLERHGARWAVLIHAHSLPHALTAARAYFAAALRCLVFALTAVAEQDDGRSLPLVTAGGSKGSAGCHFKD